MEKKCIKVTFGILEENYIWIGGIVHFLKHDNIMVI